jgi:hypothetical protein
MNAIRMLAAAAALVACGCGGSQAHIIPGFGDSGVVFAKQAGNRPAATAATGLDSQEARIVSKTYRDSLARKEEKPKEEPYIMVTPQMQPMGQPLLPSVPRER